MTFMLGGFTNGLTEGAKSMMGMFGAASDIDLQKERTRGMRQQNDWAQDAHDTAKAAQLEASAPQALPVAGTTPSDTRVEGGTPGTTTSGPITPDTFESLPVPGHLQGVNTAGPSYSASTPMGQYNNPEAPGSQQPTTVAGPASGPTANPGPSPDQSVGYTQGAAAPGNPQGRMIWSAERGLHRAMPGEAGMTWSADRGLHRTEPSAWAGPPADAHLAGSALPAGPDLSRVTNRPVGTAVRDWWRGTTTPAAPLKHPVGASIARALNIGDAP